MKKREWIRKGAAAALTLVFLALIRPTELPALWITAALGIGFYEIALYTVDLVIDEIMYT